MIDAITFFQVAESGTISWRANCLARGDTNGADLRSSTSFVGEPRQPNALIIDTASTVRLPNSFVPSLPTLPEDSGVVKSYSLPGRKTGVVGFS